MFLNIIILYFLLLARNTFITIFERIQNPAFLFGKGYYIMCDMYMYLLKCSHDNLDINFTIMKFVTIYTWPIFVRLKVMSTKS